MNTCRGIIKEWENGPFPPGLFQKNGELLILEEEGAGTLIWADTGACLWRIPEVLVGQFVQEVYYGPLMVTCGFTLEILSAADTGWSVKGTLTAGMGSGEGNAGTFTAEGSGSPPRCLCRKP